MFYTIYKITNKVTGQIYIGQHVTDNLDDGYMGSGIRISRSIAKYGKDLFDKEILFVFNNFEDMNDKEAELVNEAFIKRSDTLNVVLGGTGWCSKGTVCVEDLSSGGVFIRIPVDQFDPCIHRYPTSGSVQVYLKTTGKVSVRCKTTGETLSISLNEFDETLYEKVLGGIVVEKDGKRQYISREEFIDGNFNGVHVGKVTALDKETGIRKHITRDEYYKNKNRYLPNGTGTTVVKDTITGKRVRIPTEMVDKTQHIVGTTGWVTVYDMTMGKFMNIPKGTFDHSKHKRATDKKFICYNPDGSIRFEFWGGKQEFLKKYKCPVSVWEAAVNSRIFTSNREKSREFNGCKFVIIAWKP